MRKQIFLFSAIFWTGIILFLSLENAKNIPPIDIPFLDKVIHSGFHFVFTVLWFLYLKKKYIGANKVQLLFITIIGSFVLGIAIELMQQYYTTTRNGDIFDILANLFGAFLAAVAIIMVNAINGIIDKI
ncbi:MAG TPA: VanZ family protein [Flavobacterium sp.]|nr:VanZ family protein [Flavobacterium sp.]